MREAEDDPRSFDGDARRDLPEDDVPVLSALADVHGAARVEDELGLGDLEQAG